MPAVTPLNRTFWTIIAFCFRYPFYFSRWGITTKFQDILSGLYAVKVILVSYSVLMNDFFWIGKILIDSLISNDRWTGWLIDWFIVSLFAYWLIVSRVFSFIDTSNSQMIEWSSDALFELIYSKNYILILFLGYSNMHSSCWNFNDNRLSHVNKNV